MPVVSAPTFRWIALLPHAWRVRAARCHAVGAPRRSGARYRFMHPPQGRAPASQTWRPQRPSAARPNQGDG